MPQDLRGPWRSEEPELPLNAARPSACIPERRTRVVLEILDYHQPLENEMNLGNRFGGPKIIHGYMQPTELFHSQNVSEYCEYRERQIELEIHRIPHTEILSLDRETMFTRLINTYLSDEITDYPKLNKDEAELLRNSTQTTVTALHRIPWTGSEWFFTLKPVNEYDPPSTKVTIHWIKSTRRSPFTTSYLSMTPKEASKSDSKYCWKMMWRGSLNLWMMSSVTFAIMRHD